MMTCASIVQSSFFCRRGGLACMPPIALAAMALLIAATQAQELSLSRTPPTTAERARLREEAKSQWADAQRHLAQNRPDEAIESARKVLQAMRKADASLHQDFLTVLNWLAHLQERSGNFTEAKQSRSESLEIQIRLFGDGHWQAADARQELKRLDKYASLSAAERERLYATWQRSWEVFRLNGQGKLAEALKLAETNVLERKILLGDTDPEYASSLQALADIQYSLGQFSTAEPLAREYSRLIKASQGEAHPNYATSLALLAKLGHRKGDFINAESLYLQAIEIRKKTVGEAHVDVAMEIQNLAELYREREEYARAAPLYGQALEILKKNRRENDATYGVVLHNLALVLQEQGDFAKAETMERQALEIQKKAVGEMHPYYAASLNGLAGIYQAMGDLSRAEPRYREALEIRRKTLGESHPAYALTLHNLGVVYERKGDLTQARTNFRQALEIRKKALGPHHPDVANGLVGLASLCRQQGDYAQAALLTQQAVDIVKQSSGEKSAQYAANLNRLAVIYHMQSDYTAAEPLYQQAVEIQKSVLGETHPDCVEAIGNLAALYWCQGDAAKAEPLMKQALHSARKNLELCSLAQSERQQIVMTLGLRNRLDSYLTMATSQPTYHRSAYDQLFAWKGIVSRRQQHFRDALLDPIFKKTFAELESVARELSRLAFATPVAGQPESWRRRLRELSERLEQLEADLSRNSAEFGQATGESTVAALQTAVGEHVFVDCFEYLHWRADKTAQGGRVDERRLLAYVVRKDHDPVLIEFGPALPLYELAEAWLAGFGDAPPAVAAGKRLREAIWEKLEPHLDQGRCVLVSPDGPLNRLPLAALPGKRPGSYLIEDWSIAVIPYPQSLIGWIGPASEVLAQRREPSANRKLLVLGNINYDARLDTSTASQKMLPPKVPNRFDAVEGAQDQLAMIKELGQKRLGIAGVTALEASAATEEAFRRHAPAHQYLHLATHGFFAPEAIRSVLSRRMHGDALSPMPLGTEQTLAGYHPDLLCGVVLAGANRSQPENADDGIFTAAEVRTLDLRQVDLAVLSACETGLGSQAGGEGLLSLQRSFHVAGAKTVVASLWKVPTHATREMLNRFYENLWMKRMGKLEALRDAQVWMLRERGEKGLFESRANDTVPQPTESRLPPFFWAGFVLSGDWR